MKPGNTSTTFDTMPISAKPRIGISACLLGNAVRFDGGHKNNRFVHDTLSRFVDLVPVCPEVGSGMPVPRESLRLVADRLVSGVRGVRLVGNRSGDDHTARMIAWAEPTITQLATLDLDGFILKKDSPSCGIERVRLYRDIDDHHPSRTGTGIFAALLRQRMPTLPMTEEGWLCDARRRESFLGRIFTHYRMRSSLLASPSHAGLIAFHAEHKYLYLAHSPARYRDLGRLVAHATEQPLRDTIDRYASEALAALAEPTTPGKHANVLQHIIGHFKKILTSFEKHELLSLVGEFRAGLHGLVVPLTLLVHHLRKHEIGGWLASQVYFQPYPRGLAPR